MAPTVWIVPQILDHVSDLIHTAKVPPLFSIHRSEVSVPLCKCTVGANALLKVRLAFGPLGSIRRGYVTTGSLQIALERPVRPDGYPLIYERLDAGGSGEEPEHFAGKAPKPDPFGRANGKPLGQVEAHLVAEHAERSDSRAILLALSVAQHKRKKV